MPTIRKNNNIGKKGVEKKVSLPVRRLTVSEKRKPGRPAKVVVPSEVPVKKILKTQNVKQEKSFPDKELLAKKTVVRKEAVEEQDVNSYIEDLIQKRRAEARLERKKVLILRTGVSVFMIMVVLVWVFNMRNVFSSTMAKETEDTSSDDWKKMTQELGEQIDEMKGGISDIKGFVASEKNIQKLKEELSVELAATSSVDNLATYTPSIVASDILSIDASSTATSTEVVD